MKRYLFFVAAIFVISCQKDEPEPNLKPFAIDEISLCDVRHYDSANADFLVKSVDDFLTSVSNSKKGDIIYLEDNTFFDFSNEDLPIRIDKQIKIVSGRKANNADGAIMYSDVTGESLLKIETDSVILNGLKIIGYDTEIGTDMYVPSVTNGISIENKNYLTVENCEISGWSLAGIYLNNSSGNKIIKNFIHHNQRFGLGYGVVLYNDKDIPTDALVSCNNFEYNRHDIAASGNEGQSYEASYNIVRIGSESHHRFDMHGKNEEKERIAGTEINIHHNWFMSKKGYAVKIRGIPENSANIYENTFAHKNQTDAILQTILLEEILPEDQINLNIFNNEYLNSSL